MMRYTFMFAVMMFAQLGYAFFLGSESADQKTHNGLSLRLFGESEHTRVRGVDLCFWDSTDWDSGTDDFQGLNLGIVSRFEDDMNGVQGNLLFSYGRMMKGLQLGVLNGVGVIKGFQLGAINVVEGDINGFQLGVLNVVINGEVNGFQLGVLNASSYVNGFQLGVVNGIERGDVDGFQLGMLNTVFNDGGGINGFQLGVFNRVDGDVNGFQLGLLNTVINSGNVHGYQIGLFNYAPEGVSRGAQIGLLNFKEGSWWVIPCYQSRIRRLKYGIMRWCIASSHRLQMMQKRPHLHTALRVDEIVLVSTTYEGYLARAPRAS